MPLPADTNAVQRLARAYGRLLDTADAHTARERIADAFADLVACDQVVVFDIGVSGAGAVGEAGLLPVVTRGAAASQRGGRCLSLPLVAHDEPLGVVDVVRFGRPFDDGETELAAALAEAAAVALHGAMARQRLELLSQTDPLTGLFNHRHFYDRLEGELARARRSGEPVTLVLVDLDDFKRVNDVHGHGVGDGVLVGLARLLLSAVRVSDVVCRVGGEEFAVIMPSCDAEGAEGFVGRLADTLHDMPFDTAGYVTVSAGIATGPLHASSPRELFGCADTALHAAKARGKDRAVVFEDAALPELPGASPREVRSLAHMRMLQSLAGRLGRSRELGEVAGAIVEELRPLLGLHSCSVHVAVDGHVQVAGAGSDGCGRCDAELALPGSLAGGELVAGAVATGRPRLLTRPSACAAGQLETVAVVPFIHGAGAVGAVEAVKAGDRSLDGDDVRLLEVLAGQAAAAVVNARLHEEQRREVQRTTALVRFAEGLAVRRTASGVAAHTVEGIAHELGALRSSLWLPAPGDPGSFEPVATWGCSGRADQEEIAVVRSIVQQALPSLDPIAPLPLSLCRTAAGARSTLVLAPLGLDAGSTGVIALVVRDEGLSDEKLRLLTGLAGSARLALGTALELDELRRLHGTRLAA